MDDGASLASETSQQSGPPRKGVVLRMALGASSLPSPVPSRSDRPRKGARLVRAEVSDGPDTMSGTV